MENKVIFVDVDETICTHPDSDPTSRVGARNYENAVPIVENIEKINALYDAGNTIVYWTARGSRSGIDWTDLTKQQLIEWGAKHHGLRLDKPYFDVFVDDKNLRIEEV